MNSSILTEFISFQLSSLKDFNNAESDDGKAWRRIITVIASETDCFALHWGHQIEKPDWVCVKIGTSLNRT